MQHGSSGGLCIAVRARARVCRHARAYTQRTHLCRPTAPMGSFASAHLITLRSPRGAPHRPRRSPSLSAACWRVACMGRAVARATCRYTEAAQCRPHAMAPTSAQLRSRARGRVKGAASAVPQNHEMRQHHTWQHERRLSTLNRGHAVHSMQPTWHVATAATATCTRTSSTRICSGSSRARHPRPYLPVVPCSTVQYRAVRRSTVQYRTCPQYRAVPEVPCSTP